MESLTDDNKSKSKPKNNDETKKPKTKNENNDETKKPQPKTENNDETKKPKTKRPKKKKSPPLNINLQEHLSFLFNSVSAIFNYRFENLDLLHLALTRNSAIAEKNPFAYSKSNDNLELLGDSLLNFMVGEYVYNAFPHSKEGELTILRTKTVHADSLGEFAISKKLGQYYIISKADEINGVRNHNKLLAHLFKSICASIYIDCKFDMKKTKAIIRNFLAPHIKLIKTQYDSTKTNTSIEHKVKPKNK